MEFINGLRRILLDMKIYIKLHFVYASQEKYKKIRSILPSSIINVGNYVSIEKDVIISNALTTLEDGLYIGKGTYIGSCSSIGKYCSISFDVKIGVISHPLNFISTSPVFYAKRRGWITENTYDENAKGYVEIGNDVLISANVIITAGVKIGNGAVIGAGAFVNKDIPPYAIVAGVPAKIIKYRFTESEIVTLENSKWWEKSKAELLNFKDLFSKPMELVQSLDSKKKNIIIEI